MTVQHVFMNPFGAFFEVQVPLYTRHIEKERKVGTSVIRTLSLIWYYSTAALDKGVRIIEFGLYLFYEVSDYLEEMYFGMCICNINHPNSHSCMRTFCTTIPTYFHNSYAY